MMTKYVALLRGINVGGNNKVEMHRLRKCFENLGFENILTYINSGNVIFETVRADEVALVNEIEAKFKEVFGFEIRLVVRNFESIKKIYEKIPNDWLNDVDQKTDVIFLWAGVDSKESTDTIKTNPEVDTLLHIDRAIVWHLLRKNYSKSGMHKFIGTNIYKNMTARNVNTVRKLYKLMEIKNGD